MKKTTLVLALGALCASILSGCKSKSRYKTPKTPFEKVTVALNGVTKSFENYKYEESTSSSAKTRSGKRIAQSDASGALADIADIYKSYDTQGDRVDELDLDKPPMIQFQCLKRFVETVGSGYSFGTKYTDTITGTVYFDPSTGDKKEANDIYKYNYAFTFALAIEIDNSDVIISKGLGNFETLHKECALNIYYLFLCKCDFFADMFNVKVWDSVLTKEKM